jgi:O-antigen/teichoic acid export membrane protein
VLWKLIETSGRQLIGLLLTIVTSRVFYPEDLGKFIIPLLVVGFFDIFIQNGSPQSIIFHKFKDDESLSTAFWSNLMTSLCFFALLSGWSFVWGKGVYSILLWLSITLILNGFSSVYNSILIRDGEFKLITYSYLASQFIGGLVLLLFLHFEIGIWALVVQQITQSIVLLLFSMKFVSWRPKYEYSGLKYRQMSSYSIKLQIFGLVGQISNELRNFVIARFYSLGQSTIYYRANSVATLFSNNFLSAIMPVFFANSLSLKSNLPDLKESLNVVFKYTGIIYYPSIVCLFLLSDKLVILLFSVKWLGVITYLRILLVASIFLLHQWLLFELLKILNMGSALVYLDLTKRLLDLAILMLALLFDVYYVVLSAAIVSVVYSLFLMFVFRRIIDFSIKEQLNGFVPSLTISIFSGFITYSLSNHLNLSSSLSLFYEGIFFWIIYIGFLYFFNREVLCYLITKFRNVFN